MSQTRRAQARSSFYEHFFPRFFFFEESFFHPIFHVGK